MSPLNIIVKEINIEQGLNDTASVNNPVVLVVGLVVGAIDPIEDVEEPIGAQQKHVMPCQVLYFSVSLQRDQLGNDRH